MEDFERCLAALREPTNVAFDDGVPSEQESCTDAAIMVDHLSREIRAIDDALKRLAEGAFGVCIQCGRQITKSRLLANPIAARCIRCQARFERKAG